MNLHPTPFPGKRRPAGNVASKNETDHHRSAASLTQSKPKRTFGRNLCGNVVAMVQRPVQKPITTNPWKPSGVSKKTINPVTKPLNTLPSARGAKHDSSKKAQHVTFREIPPPAPVEDLLLSTPVFSTEPLLEETPYRTAENCSKCRLDSLETSSYWLSQIKIAESTGKHSVSAAFFRLALDCNAQPFVYLQNELKHYRDRHEIFFMGTMWVDLLRDYGFKSDQVDTDSGDCDSFDAVIVEQFNSKVTASEQEAVDRDICAGYDIIDKLEDLEDQNNAPEEIITVKHSEDGLQVENSPMESPLTNFPNVDNLNSKSGLRGDAGKAVMIARNKSKFGILTSNDSAAIIYDQVAGQAGTMNSGSRSAWNKEFVDKIGSNNLLKSKSKDREKRSSTHLDETVNTAEEENNLESRENATFSQFLDVHLPG